MTVLAVLALLAASAVVFIHLILVGSAAWRRRPGPPALDLSQVAQVAFPAGILMTLGDRFGRQDHPHLSLQDAFIPLFVIACGSWIVGIRWARRDPDRHGDWRTPAMTAAAALALCIGMGMPTG